MNHEDLLSFIKDAELDLPMVRSGFLVYLNDGRISTELEIPLRQILVLKGTASRLGLDEIENIAAYIEVYLKPAFEGGEPLMDGKARDVLDLLARLEAIVLNTRHQLEDFSMDVSGFVEDSFSGLTSTANDHNEVQMGEVNVAQDVAAEDEFEIDDELLEIFRMEADDLLKSIGANLDILSGKPDDHDALWEIRRNAHTFKGAAGIVGFKQASELAHRVEDLLDYLAENKIESNGRIVEILRDANVCLNAITYGENSPGVHERISAVYRDFDALMDWLKSPDASYLAEPPQVSIIEEEAASTEVDRPSDAANAARRQARSVVRVSLERLDDLVKIVHGLVVSRSVFEQRLAEFDQQISDLRNSTRRLQSASSKFEIDFEADFLGAGIISNRAVQARQNDFDALEMDQYTEFHQTTRELAETTGDTFAINSALSVLKGNLDSVLENQRRLIDDLQEKLLRIRMVEFGTLSTRLNRAVRITCDEENKKADLTIENERLEIDTQILDALIEPLLHLLRNSVVHGIETPDTRRLVGKPEKGSINIRIVSEETHVVLKVSDDGRGISPATLKAKAVKNGLITQARADAMTSSDALKLIFLPGLTTAERLNLNAGRGVGMSIVKESVENRFGSVTVTSEPQRGTTFTIRMPLTLAVTHVLLVKAKDQTFALPLKLVRQITEFPARVVAESLAAGSIEIEGEDYPFAPLNTFLHLPVENAADGDNAQVLLIETSGNMSAVVVDRVIKTEEIVIKPLRKPLDAVPNLLGATILGSGEIVPVLDLSFLVRRRETDEIPVAPVAVDEVEEISVMIVDDSPSVRHLTSKVIQNAGWQVIAAKHGLDALEILESGKKLPNVILTDVEMPHMDGYELLSALKQKEGLREIPVVMITSRAAEKHREKAASLGVSDYLTKPFADSELVGLIKNLAL